jgi:hypothetical protein
MSMFASIGPNLPHDLFAATGRYDGPVAFDPDRSHERAAQWLESKFAPWAFPVLEGWVAGDYDEYDHVVFSRADDTAHRLYYYLCELQRRGLAGGPEPLVFDVAKIARPSSIERMTGQLRLLAKRLGAGPEDLERAIVLTNGRRMDAGPVPQPGRPCLLAGTAAPDGRLSDAVAAAGFMPIGRTLHDDWSNLGSPVAEGTGDPFTAIARQLHGDPSGPRSAGDPAARLREQIAECRAQAVILWRIEEDEAEAWHLPDQLQAIAHTGVPALVMTRRDWLARDGATDEIARFLGGLEQ